MKKNRFERSSPRFSRKNKSGRESLRIDHLEAICFVLVNRPDLASSLCISTEYKKHFIEKQVYALSLAEEQGIPVHEGSKEERFELILKPYPYQPWDLKRFERTGSRILVLDELKDPHNLGALCRSALAFGWRTVVIPKNRSVSVTSGVYHSAVGTVVSLDVVKVTNIANSLIELAQEGYYILGAAKEHHSQDIFQFDSPKNKIALVLGSEDKGLRQRVKEQCTDLVQISHDPLVESLNVSVAGSLLMGMLSR